jgi:hypothetical protein
MATGSLLVWHTAQAAVSARLLFSRLLLSDAEVGKIQISIFSLYSPCIRKTASVSLHDDLSPSGLATLLRFHPGFVATQHEAGLNSQVSTRRIA